MKLGRNDPCYCGSGKKYKKCHLGKESISTQPLIKENKSQTLIEKFIGSFDSIDLLKTIAALQLLPENHGKNVRIEILVTEIIKQIKTGRPKISYRELNKFFAENLKEHQAEDTLSSFFTENVIFFGGDFTVFPGLNHNGTRILNSYLIAIFTKENTLPEEFKKKVQDGVTLILALCDLMAEHSNMYRYMYVESELREITIPQYDELEKLKDTVCFNKNYLEKVANHYHVDSTVINDFIISPKDEGLNSDNPDENPVLKKPILKVGEEFIFLLPSVTINSLVEFIISSAKEFKCSSALLDCFYDYQFYRIRELFHEMGWKETDIQLPPLSEGSNFEETVFQFDNDKLAYLCFIKPINFPDEEISRSEIQTPSHDERNKEVIEHLRELNTEYTHKYLTLFVTGENGRDFFFTWGEGVEDNLVLGLSFGDFEKIVLSEESDRISLWKFAKIYKATNEISRIVSIAGMLDAYALYKNNNESLLPPDDARPNPLFFPQGISSEFEREIIFKRDEHSAWSYTEHGLIPYPVKRLRTFAPIYWDREKTGQINLLLEVFPFPIWVDIPRIVYQ